MGGRTRVPRRRTGAVCCREHIGCRRDPHTAYADGQSQLRPLNSKVLTINTGW